MKPVIFITLLMAAGVVQANALDNTIETLKASGAGPFSAERGEKAWQRTVVNEKSAKPRSCGDCHGDDLGKPGKHIKTGKRIEPMAPTINPKRLSDGKKIKKWFKRNCQWTWGRECTAQEKGDLLLFLQQN
jgi:hypothetical protein